MRRRWLVGSLTLAAVVAIGLARAARVLRSIAGHDAYWFARAAQPGELLYVALGDSTAQGVGSPRPERGYVGRLADELAQRTGRTVRVVNLSVSGARVGDLVRVQLPVLRRLLADGARPELVTVTIGANDTGRTSLEEFRASMRVVVEALPAGARVADVPYFRGGRGRDARAFSAVIHELVAERGDLVAVDLFDATGGLGPLDYGADLFHPSARGYERYFRAFTR